MDLYLKLRQDYAYMSKNHQKIADYLLSNMASFVNLTAATIGKNSGTSAASVTRFAKQLGYSGLYELKNDIIRTLQTKQSSHNHLLDPIIKADDTTTILTEKIKILSENSIHDLFYQLDVDILNQAILRVRSASKIYLVGIGASSLAAYDLYHKFNRINKTTFFNFESHMMVEFIHHISKDDVLLVFSYSGNSTEVIYPTEIALQRQATVIAVTRNHPSKLANLACQVIYIPNSEDILRVGAITSRMNMMIVADLIYLGTIQPCLSSVKQSLIATNDLTKKFKMKL